MLFGNKGKIKIDVEVVTRFDASWSNILAEYVRGNGTTVWRILLDSRYLRIHRAKEGECKQYVFEPTTPRGGLWYKLKQVWNGKWRRHAKGRREREREAGRERKGKGLHESSPLSLELEQWKLVKFKRIFDRIADIRARKWEKNIRRTLVDVHWYNEGYLVQPSRCYSPEDSPGNIRENGARRGLGNRAGILTFIRFWPMILQDKSD